MNFQTKEFRDLIYSLNFVGIFSQDFKNALLLAYTSKNIEQASKALILQLRNLKFLSDEFINRIEIAFEAVIEYRQNQ